MASTTTTSFPQPSRKNYYYHDKRQQLSRQIIRPLLSQSHPILLAASSRRRYSNQQPHQQSLYTNVPVSVTFSSVASSIARRAIKVPPKIISKLRERNPPKNAGYYYGLQPDKIFPYMSSQQIALQESQEKEMAIEKTLKETLEEMKSMRKELLALRREMYEMRKKITGEKDLEFEGAAPTQVDPEVTRLAQQKRQRFFDKIGKEVEDWARQRLFEEDRLAPGWVQVACNKVIAKNVNGDGRTTCYLSWMKDSRGKLAFKDDDREYPVIKVYSTIDAPLEDVCTYLSRKDHMLDYNFILTEQKDLEEIAPHSKITWATSPQVLFIKPRDFVTFVYHRWLKDGSVVLINQACEHPSAPAVTEEGKGKACRAYALRGATFMSPDPHDPNKTRMALIAHAAPGGGFPQWMTKTAINAVAPLEPFKLFHQINQKVLESKSELERLKLERAEQVSIPGRSKQPVGIAQIGFACFWPNGGGLLPPGSSSPEPKPTLQNDNSTTSAIAEEADTSTTLEPIALQ